MTSMLTTIGEYVSPTGQAPVHEAMNGTRTPPSAKKPLPPLNGALSDQFWSGAMSDTVTPPLSLRKNISVSSRLPASSSADISLPTLSSSE